MVLTKMIRSVLAVVTLAALTSNTVPASQDRRDQPRIVAIGDIHGAGDAFVGILAVTGLIDAQQRWSGGTATLVQTGDSMERGPQVRQVLDLLMRLEGEARSAGGRAEVLLGNHEVMSLLREFRDTPPETFASFADERSEERRRNASRAEHASAKDQWLNAHPPGFVEYVEALGPRGKYGRWLRSRKVVAKLDGTIFMHAGLRPDTKASLDDINRTVEREIKTWDEAVEMLERNRRIQPYSTFREILAAAGAELDRISAALQSGRPAGDDVSREYVDHLQAVVGIGKSSLLAADGPLWFRGLATSPEPEIESQVQKLLDRYGASRFVVAHTPSVTGRIIKRFGGRVFTIDTGMLSTYFKNGRASALELQGDRITAIYPDTREVLAEGSKTQGVLIPLP